jgi:hypothetical protein
MSVHLASQFNLLGEFVMTLLVVGVNSTLELITKGAFQIMEQQAILGRSPAIKSNNSDVASC